MQMIRIKFEAVVAIALLIHAVGCGDDTDSKNPSSKQPDAAISDSALYKYCPGSISERDGTTYCTVEARDELYTSENVDGEDALNWKKDIVYVLQGRIFIGDDVNETVLTIEPGTRILGSPETDPDNASSLIIQRGSKIVAEGTAEAPIVFTSGYEVGDRSSDDWGGVVINGRAPINTCAEQPCEATGEGNTGTYGGDDPEDDSGTLAYVRIEFSGKRLTATKEFNGLALQGVGSNTDIHHIHIHRAGDDCIEFFGGNAYVHHILLTGTGDDFFDWTNGWTGKAQFVIGMEVESNSNFGIEADNHETEFDKAPRSNPILYNFTLPKGILLRRGTGATLVNFLIDNGNSNACLNIEHSATWKQQEAGSLSISNSIVLDDDCFFDDDAEGLGLLESDLWESGAGNRIAEDFLLSDAKNQSAPVFVPKSNSPALEGAGDAPKGDDFIETVSFVGGMGEEDWTAGWTEFPEN